MDPFELRLAGVLRSDAERAVVDIDAAAIADEATRAKLHRRSRRMWLLPAVAAVLLGASMLGGTLFLGSAPDRAETGPTSRTPSDGPMAILLRWTPEERGSVKVVGLRPTGEALVLRTLTPADLGAEGGWFSPIGSVSEHGALAVHVGRNRLAVLSLATADRPVIVVSYLPEIGGRWSPTDVLATVSTTPGFWAMQAVDLDGTVREFGPISLPGSGPDIVWAADGSGVLTVLESGTYPSGIPFHRYGIAPVDGGPTALGVPELSFGRGIRDVAVGGRTLDVCVFECGWRSTPSIWVVEPMADGGHSGGEVIVEPRDLPGALVDASFAAGDRSIWMLFDRTRSGVREAVLARQPESGVLAVVATVAIDPATVFLQFDAFAADDSLVGIGHWVKDGDDRVVTIVDPATGRSVTTDDAVIGFVTDLLPESP